MKKITYYLVFLFFFYALTSPIVAQEKSNFKRISKIAFAEKIYLQLNSTVFTSDQTIWFKAVVTSVNQKPTILSKVLHVELIDFNSEIIESKLLKLEDGSTNNFFDLNEIRPLPEGKYMIRAYTKWNNNFKTNFVSKKYINIYKTRQKIKKKEPIREVVISEKKDKQLQLSAKIFPKIINPKFKGKLKVLLDFDGKKDTLQLKKDNNKQYTLEYLLPEKTVKAKIEVQLDSIKIKNFDYKSFNSFSKTIAIDKNFIDLQFFPEGGKLIHDLTSIIGFKALDFKNEGVPVKGVIKDENDVIITQFKSNKLGMGFCQLKPNKNKTYYAEISGDSKERKYKIPDAHQKGYAITAKTSQDFFRLHIRSNFSTSDSLFIKAQARGTNFLTTKVQCNNGSVMLAFKRENFPEGIVTFTVFNSYHQPMCERLVFNFKEQANRLQITTKTDKKKYLQREKVVCNIKVKSNDSLTQKENTSLLVVNKRQLGELKLKSGNILSYFLLQSELKGNIEHPNFYFDTQNSQRFYTMDALLLTQGWRNYKYKPTGEKKYFDIAPEKGLQISGAVKEFTKRKRKKTVQLSLLAKGKENLQAAVAFADSLGKFTFNLQDIYDKNLEYIIQTANKKGKKKEYSVNIKQPKPLPVNFVETEKLQLADKFNIYVKENRKRYAKLYPFDIGANGESLDEVIVKTRLLTPIQKKIIDKHGEPDVIIEDNELKEKNEKWMSGLYSLLGVKYPDNIRIFDVMTSDYEKPEQDTVTTQLPGTNLGITSTYGVPSSIVDFTFARDSPPIVSGDSFFYAHVHNSFFTFILVDGEAIPFRDYPIIQTIPIEDVKSVEIMRNPKFSSEYLNNVFDGLPIVIPDFAFISIYSNTGEGLYAMEGTKGITTDKLPCFAPQKEFYAPKHDNLTKNDWEIADLRSTVFWNPNVKTDKNGNGKVEFYTDDNIGDMLVIIESIADNGKLGYYETTYRVNKKLKN